MKRDLLLAALALMSSTGINFADTIEVNGITSLFGEKIACLVLHQPALAKPLSFALSEGESQFGIRLLAVDVVHQRVQIEQSGEKLYLRLCTAPDLTVSVPNVDSMEPPVVIIRATPEERLEVRRFLTEDREVERINFGNPLAPLAYIGADYPKNPKSGGESGQPANNSPGSSDAAISPGNAGNSASASNAANSGDSPSTSSNGSADSQTAHASNSSTASRSPGPAAVDVTSQYWYVTSMSIEKNRLATAPEVMNGEMEALPATPLTPAGTPVILIGAQTYFANHILGFPDTSIAD